MNNTGEDRVVRATIPLSVKATLLFETEMRKETFQKRYSVKQVTFKSETQTFNVNVVDPPPGGYSNTYEPSRTLDRFDPGNTNQARRRITDPMPAINQRDIHNKRYIKRR
jgi:hypothetical protein